MAENGSPQIQRICRRGVYLQRSLDRVHRRLVVVRDEADRKTGGSERFRVVGSGLDRGPRMQERSLLVRLLQTAAHVALFMAQSGGGVGSRIIRLEREGLTKQFQRLVRLAWHMNANMRERVQIKIVGIKAVRPLALGPLDLGVKQARLDCADDA